MCSDACVVYWQDLASRPSSSSSSGGEECARPFVVCTRLRTGTPHTPRLYNSSFTLSARARAASSHGQQPTAVDHLGGPSSSGGCRPKVVLPRVMLSPMNATRHGRDRGSVQCVTGAELPAHALSIIMVGGRSLASSLASRRANLRAKLSLHPHLRALSPLRDSHPPVRVGG